MQGLPLYSLMVFISPLRRVYADIHLIGVFNMAYLHAAFIGSFNNTLETLKGSERLTKDTLQGLSRDFLMCLHDVDSHKHGDIGFINRTINVLTPVNKRKFFEFMLEFTGFTADKEGTHFVEKHRKAYKDVQEKALEWLSDPLNNFWSWAERGKEIVPKEFTMEAVKKTMEGVLKKAEKNHFSKVDVLQAVMGSGFTIDELVQAMDKLGQLADVVENIETNYEQQ